MPDAGKYALRRADGSESDLSPEEEAAVEIVLRRAADLEAAELALRRALQDPYKSTVRIVRPDGPLVQTHVKNLPELLDALRNGWTIHADDS